MKKLLLFFTACLFIFGVSACKGKNNDEGGDTNGTGGSDQSKTVHISGELSELLDKVYELSDAGIEFARSQTDISTNQTYYLGVEGLNFTEGLASEPLIGAIAHSVVLLRVSEDADIEYIKTQIKENVDGRKWICVGVDDREKIIVDNLGDLIILIMDNNHSVALHEGFLKLADQSAE